MGAQFFVLHDGCNFFASEIVLSRGGGSALTIGIYPQINNLEKKPSSLGQAGAWRLLS